MTENKDSLIIIDTHLLLQVQYDSHFLYRPFLHQSFEESFLFHIIATQVEKYKEICEGTQMSARQGNYDPGEEEILVQKGRVLYSCYIDSLLPPKVQINITHDKVKLLFPTF